MLFRSRDIGSDAVIVSLIDNSVTRSLNAPSYNASVSLSGNNLSTIVNGDAFETVNWVTTLRYQKIG